MNRDTGDEQALSDLDLTRLLQTLTVESDRYAERFGAHHGLHRTDVNALALIDRLAALGHVERTRPAGDRRRVALEVPEAALEEGRRMFVPLAVAFAEAWTGFEAAEREVVPRFLEVSTAAMREAGANWGHDDHRGAGRPQSGS